MNRFSHFIKRMIPSIYIGIIMLFLYFPIIVLVIYSFNSVPKSFVWGGFTFEHYINLFSENEGKQLFESLLTTLKVALIASVTATFIAVLSCLGMQYLRKRTRGLLLFFTSVPNIMPELVTGISFMLLFAFLGLKKGQITLILAHIAFCVPFAVLSIMPKFRQLDVNLAEAAMDLGATEFQTLTKVIIPEIMPGIITSVMLTFTMSVDDYFISNFNVDSTIQTLPMRLYAMAKFGVNPKMNALTTLMFIVILVLLIIYNVVGTKKQKQSVVNRK